ncbi:unnamed protein product [Vicia faba]|uniref:Uncharacterized protein n=1 Tax=Vicia faba TaxID=3906 RepID=A0AAV1BAN5_VICFA|nr:unnamed protein product [Vicia faba]
MLNIKASSSNHIPSLATSLISVVEALAFSCKVVAIVLTSDLSFFQNLFKGGNMEMAYELAYNMFKASSIFSFVSTGHGDALAPGSPFKEKDIWKWKVEAMEIKCTNLQKELVAL